LPEGDTIWRTAAALRRRIAGKVVMDARPAVIARLKARARARFICLIHDVIPIDYPEYAKPGQAENHRNRIETAARFADALIVNSAVTREALRRHLDRFGRAPPIRDGGI